jgi:hypothetical protein
VLLVIVGLQSVDTHTLPSNFVDEIVASCLTTPVSFAHFPDWVLFAERRT